jgi:hypothetical protein
LMTVRRVENGRLVYYRQRADPEFWEEFWRDRLEPSLYAERP